MNKARCPGNIVTKIPSPVFFIQVRGGNSQEIRPISGGTERLFHRYSKRKSYKVLPEVMVELDLSCLAQYKHSSSSTGRRSAGR